MGILKRIFGKKQTSILDIHQPERVSSMDTGHFEGKDVVASSKPIDGYVCASSLSDKVLYNLKPDIFFEVESLSVVKGYGKSNVYIKECIAKEAVSKHEANVRKDKAILEAANNNNKAQSLEKKGEITEAIKLYEMNIKSDSHITITPYKRLCIIYRSLKDYDNEIRVATLALQRITDKSLTAWFEDRINKASSKK